MNFQGFSPDSFEQFIRAISISVIGPGVTIFGNGPDGGREATFQGKVNYPFPADTKWDGYGVLQAKFKEKTESTQKDQQWAKSQLEAELNLWVVNDNRTPKPDYFIFCTNVELSSAANGGKDAIKQILENYKVRSELKDYAIWDANQLLAYVDSYSEIRRRFECFFTTGDLLAEIAKKLSKAVNPDSVLTSYLCKEILADEDARLSQAGDRSEDRIRLANVFIDLPVIYKPNIEIQRDEAFEYLPSASLHDLLHAASFKLDPLALEDHRQEYKNEEYKTPRIYGRFVFLGGPGSGKSTIGQFLAQIHRAALLNRREPHRIEDNVRGVIKEIKARCEEERAVWPSTPRYPFRVELNAFAKALSKNEVKTLSEYLRRNLSQDLTLDHEDLREWLKLFPWLLILDGLDEVPTSSNRRDVIAAIQNFLNEARDVEADLMVVASSRPDGYAGEFDSEEVAHRYLLPLSKQRALACAQRYVNAKTASKGNQRALDAMATLTNAINNPLIAKLMCSPLQVTFMVTVVSASGKPSDSRWQLFNDYYRIIYERELHKAVPPFDVALNERRPDIDALHHRVGFILQCRAESSGGTQADLSIVEFEELVIGCLKENGLPDSELEAQKQMIMGAANQRLVFLTSRTPGRLSFDVRSLQEYMAAACLTNADSKLIIHRLDTIAHSAYWRNTLLFAIGRFFVEPQMRNYRDNIRLFCEDLNHVDDDRAKAKLGSHLALEILESGIIGNMPLINRSLIACALELLANPFSQSDNLISRLANIYSPAVETEFQEQIDIWIGQQSIARSLSAWMLVLRLEKKGISWATQQISKNWPKVPGDAAIVLSTWFSQGHTTDALDTERLERLVPLLSFREYTNGLFNGLFSVLIDTEYTKSTWLSPLTQWLNIDGRIEPKLNINSDVSGISLRFHCISDQKKVIDFQAIKSLGLEKTLHNDWNLLIAIADFHIDPDIVNLANTLEYIANSSEQEDWGALAEKSPWPIAVHLKNANSKTELLTFVEQIRSNLFGDTNQWLMKEVKWREEGINIEELCNPLFEKDINLSSAIIGISVSDGNKKTSIPVLQSLFNHLINSDSYDVRNTISWILTFYANYRSSLNCLDPNLLKSHLFSTRRNWEVQDFIVDFNKSGDDQNSWIDFYDYFGQLSTLHFVNQDWMLDSGPLRHILNSFTENPSQLGLLRLAGFWCAAGRQVDTNPNTLLPFEKFKEPKYRLSAMLVRMSQKNLSSLETNQIADQLPFVVGEESEPQALDILVSAIEHHAKEVFVLDTVLKKLIEIIPANEWQLRARAENLRQPLLQAKPSGFNDAKLIKLNLPLINHKELCDDR
ncbi:MAG: NACHT domain-containing protein [Methylovulum sp.]